jgi:hypothetical protein
MERNEGGEMDIVSKTEGRQLITVGGMTPQYKATKRYQERHKRLGLCVDCSRKIIPGLLHCQVCQDRISKRRMVLRPLFCLECRKLIETKDRRRGRSFHKLCSEKRKSRWYPQRHLLAALAYQKRHKELGLCQNCSRKVFKWDLCRQHFEVVKERHDRVAAGWIQSGELGSNDRTAHYLWAITCRNLNVCGGLVG